MSRNLYVCFTDIAKSIFNTRIMGNAPFNDLRKRHLNIIKQLMTLHNARFANSTGDGAVLTFEELEDALMFATGLNICCRNTSSRSPAEIKVRISIALGTVTEDTERNVQGNAVNYSSRLNSIASIDDILICDNTAQSIKDVFGNTTAALFLRKDKCDVDDFGKSTVYNISIAGFVKHKRELSLHKQMKDYLERLGIVFSNTSLSDLVLPKSIIWPVVPRPHVNLLHRGMVETLSLFSLLGWKIKVILADYADSLGREDFSDERATSFATSLESIFSERDIPIEIKRISSFFSPDSTDYCCGITKGTLFSYIASLNIGEVKSIIDKKYSSSDRMQHTKSSWNLMRPFFTLAVSLYMSSQEGNGKNLILSGIDELPMWEKCTSRSEYENMIGTIHLPMLKNKDDCQFNQNTNDLYWQSAKSLQDAMTLNNHIAKWALTMLLAIAEFPGTYVAYDVAKMDTDSEKEKIIARNYDVLFTENEIVPSDLLPGLAKKVFDFSFSRES